MEKVRREVARHAEFAASGQIAEVNEKICEARPSPQRTRPSRYSAAVRTRHPRPDALPGSTC
jgi:hypothetical protein